MALRRPPSIEAFGEGGFRVSGVWRPGSLLILGDQPLAWAPQTLEILQTDDFSPVIEAGPAVSEFVLLGTGAHQSLPPRTIRDAIRQAGLGLEFMATDSAARLYNVLASQGRRVAAALIAL